MDKQEKLRLWQERLQESDEAFGEENARMAERERLYAGDPELRPLTPGERRRGETRRTGHVRNIVFENIEAQVSPGIPKPKVTARRREDEELAGVIEHFLRNELDRLPFERLNDLAERAVLLQGAVGYLVEWDESGRRPGEVKVSAVHPGQLGPQPGVFTGFEDMDWFIVKLPGTRESVRRRWGVTLEAGGEDPGEGEAVTQYIGYARNDRGGVDRFAWVRDTVLEDLEDYQARRQPVCRSCGSPRPLGTGDGETCPLCGGDWVSREQEYEEVLVPFVTRRGLRVPGLHPEKGEDGETRLAPTRIPCYRPDRYPLVLQRSVSVYGRLLGNSDADVIRDQQNTVNRLEQKIIDRLIKAGTRITLPDKANLRTDPEDGERWFLSSPADKAMIGVYEFKGDLHYELQYLNQSYEEARQLLGITDAYQGRRDSSAVSGVAKQFSAAQTAGRLESKRVMKNAAYAELFELMFKFWLAYSDEPRPVSYRNHRGETEYQAFDRWDFLEQAADGSYVWNDRFLFSCDTEDSLAANREAMWQETRLNLQTGAFGDPAATETLILFWSKMEELHYPGAGSTREFLEQRLAREKAEGGGLPPAAGEYTQMNGGGTA